ncbi:uncharacterized protein CANTADRAFT_91225 [Suhomyces tanzawaensis NRRL Y-17324]|uniref:Uncharacterized protein n=1 Tax=Suhomyces tanzawaensis NRRL Y-17324 TaxID=984487 RepID=A0A1E4SE15_9ASCO|nr:uncharacterized protein CANTADRAFT_91225 [Suhomyces tanzawaensis NRRL Y-17324]ODV77764.1 hypothetical protein CANTADRAFT_91225 [Suhomyces tanzawaensis NRRL Y-17324]
MSGDGKQNFSAKQVTTVPVTGKTESRQLEEVELPSYTADIELNDDNTRQLLTCTDGREPLKQQL